MLLVFTAVMLALSLQLFPGVLLTCMHVVHALAAPAVDIAAPHKLALAALDVSDHVCVVSSATAQQVAAVRPRGRPVAATPSGTRDAPPPVLQAVVWRLVEEDELMFVHMEAVLVLPSRLPPRSLRHLNTVLIPVLQIRTDALERSHRPPACLHRAGARDAMTATVCGHCLVDCLSSGLTVVLVRGAQRVPSAARRCVLHGVVDELAAEPRPILNVI